MEKGIKAYRPISEVAEALDLPQHVLRFWEMRFSQIRPLKRSGGRRFYRPEDIDLLRGIKRLLYGEGYTIKGVQRILKEQGVRHAIAIGRGEPSPSFSVQTDEPSLSLSSIASQTPAVSQAPSVKISPAEEDQEEGSAHSFVPDSSDDRWSVSPPPPPPPPPVGSRVFSVAEGAASLETPFGGQQLRILRAALAEIVECAKLLSSSRQG